MLNRSIDLPRVGAGAPIESCDVDLPWPAIADHLKRHGLAFDCSIQPRRLSGGLANINVLVHVSGVPMVLRRPPAGPLPRGAHDMAREHRVLSRLWEQLPLAPRSIHYCADPDVAGAPFQLIEFREGVIIAGDRLEPLPPSAETGAALSTMLIETLLRIHAVDVDAVGLSGLGKPATYLSRTTAGWISRSEAVVDPASSACRFLREWLTSHVSDRPGQATLLHNDFKLDNVILVPGTTSPTAILDWDMATRGDPLFDLATLLSYWSEPDDPECMHQLGQMPTARAGFLTREAAAALYASLSGHSLDAFLPCRVLAMFKLGVVFHQLHAQHAHREGRYASFAALGGELLDFAVEVARGRYF